MTPVLEPKQARDPARPGSGAAAAGATRRRRIVVALAAAVTVAVTARLGVWQLDRAAQKDAIAEQIRQQAEQPVVTGRDLEAAAPKGLERLIGRTVDLQGEWVPASTVYLDNRQMGGRPGFYAVSVLRVEGLDAGLLIQQGWAPRDPADRLRVPELILPAGPVRVQGRMAPPPSRLYDFGGEDGGRVRQNLDVSARSAELGLPLLALSVLQSQSPAAPSPDGLQRDWPVVSVDVHKHHGYAFQWFALSALTAGLYVWFQVIRPRRSRR